MDAVIVTYNSETPLKRLGGVPDLFSWFDRVIVVDNASSDATCEVAREAGMQVVQLGANLGFGAAANAGAKHVQSELFGLLNPDIMFVDRAGPHALAHHFARRDVAVLGPRLVRPSGDTQDSARMVPTPMNLLIRRVSGRDFGMIQPADVTDVPWVVGGCMVIRKEAFDHVGGFDPRYFLYFEDVDLCVRLREAGWSVLADSTVVALHDHAAASRGRLWSPATRRHIRSAVRFYWRHPRFLAKSDGSSSPVISPPPRQRIPSARAFTGSLDVERRITGRRAAVEPFGEPKS